MMENITLSIAEIEALEKLARVSGMDCWFCVADNGEIWDLEADDASTPIPVEIAVPQLIDGATVSDLQAIGLTNAIRIISVLSRIITFRDSKINHRKL